MNRVARVPHPSRRGTAPRPEVQVPCDAKGGGLTVVARPALSLVETTASIATIVTLLVMLLPGMSELRRQGKESRCLANFG